MDKTDIEYIGSSPGQMPRHSPIAYPYQVVEDAPNNVPARSAGGALARNLALYTVARLGLVIVIAAVILGVGWLFGVAVPLLVALVFAVVIALPLSLVVFKSLRIRVNESIAAVDEKRRRDKAELRAKLRGDQEGGIA